MLTDALIGAGVLAVIAFMCWGDDGPLWRNMLYGLGMCGLIASVGGAIIWVSSYGT